MLVIGIMRKRIISIVLIVASIVLIAVGIVLKQNSAVVTKAIRICLECVGIG